MSVITVFKNIWRKNAPELIGLFDGSLPGFVAASRPRDTFVGIPVFCYHLITAEQFGADLQFLQRNGYATLSPQEFLEHLVSARPVPPRSVLLTFDDGPKNFFDVAFPLLREYSAKAMAFIAPGLHAETVEADNTDARPMTWPEIREVHASGLVSFQSHTFASRYVPAWPKSVPLVGCAPAIENRRRQPGLPLSEDLALSKQGIENQLPGSAVRHLSFPMYLGTEEGVAVARSLGFEACYWGYLPGRSLNVSGASPFFISRVGDEFVRRLPGEGRISVRAMLSERGRRVRVGREWRRQFPDPVL
jgi:peptidoglycan/xylan/chitin deacetylase (PgdA/CDA1 family)